MICIQWLSCQEKLLYKDIFVFINIAIQIAVSAWYIAIQKFGNIHPYILVQRAISFEISYIIIKKYCVTSDFW